MRASSISRKLANPVWAAFRRRCHELIEIGYREALPRIHSEPDEETDITGYICEAIEAWLRENPQHSVCFFVKEDPPLAGSGKTGKRRPRTDIIISYASGERPEFFFEAKRLHRKKSPASRYTGTDGIGCFVSGRYAPRYVESAMIGYVQTDSCECWQTELMDRVRLEANTLLVEGVGPAKFKSCFPLEWTSTHRRNSLPSVRILHILLDCRKE